MKVTYTTRDGRMTLEVDGTMVEIFEELSDFQEIFEDRVCAKFGEQSDNVRFRVRTDKEDNKYYEMVCVEEGELRRVKKQFNCNKKGGGLYYKNKDKDGNYKPDNGWLKWDKDKQKEV